MFDFTRESLDSSLLFVAVMAFIAAVQAFLTMQAPRKGVVSTADKLARIAGWATAGLVLTAGIVNRAGELIPVFVAFALVTGVMAVKIRRLSASGILWIGAQLVGFVVAGLWSWRFIAETGFAGWSAVLAGTALAASLLIGAAGLLASIAREAVITHEQRQPVRTLRSTRDAAYGPKVSLQLPCYAEPPEVVMATMDHLAALNYANFEVLVCDNNTADERLWRPLEAHCAVLNQRLGREAFRFFHVAPLAGAKAGALNFCLEVMAPDAEVIGVIDADYWANRDFLSRFVPCFADPELGYIQTPHDYRGYAGSNFLTACHWEYMPVNKVDWCGISKYGGAFTIGTMCLLRTEALRKAGGWADWCLTEDSEVSVRLRAAGYKGQYFGQTFGRGLIPETFDDYRKQRFRWTAGPVQQLVRHWRLLLPAPFAAPMPGWSKLLEVTRCIAPLQTLMSLVTAFLATLALGIAQAGMKRGPIDLPNICWVLMIIGAMIWGVRTVHRYRLSGCHRTRDMVLGEIARASLTYIVLIGGLAGLSRRPLAWRRTPKFAVKAKGQLGGQMPFNATSGEVIAAVMSLMLAGAILNLDAWLGMELAVLAALVPLQLALAFLCAPAMEWLGSRHAEAVATRARRMGGGSRIAVLPLFIDE